MGITYIDGTVQGPTGKTSGVTFLVDSGAQYTLLPHDVWTEIELHPKRTQSFRLVDGSPIERSVSECHVTLPQGSGHTPVILGEPGDQQPLLGVVTLKELGLMLNPFNRELQPMQMLL
ncbi:MAG: aspartyl protease family protein [Planctomycetaceae bacterium]|nr:aspartyl protease family protein [Planctomycetaceae bacterium]